jgi:hypothetical protein
MINTKQQHKQNIQGGYLLVLVLVFGAVFFLITASFFSYVFTQSQVIDQKVELQRAVDIAEAGLNYYKWYLAHYPTDVTNGTGLPGPYTHVYYDSEGGAIGEYSLSIASSTYCGDISSIDVTSSGFTYEDPSIVRTITARYARPNIAEYSYIINSSLWAGADRIIIGPYHTNGGVRMDGTNMSTVSSGQTTWYCDSGFGCSTPGNRDGVFTTTANANPALFAFPSPPINFTGLTINLAQMQDRAQNAGGIYLGPSGGFGYRVVFRADGNIDVHRVTNTASYWGFTTENGWQTERHVISASTFIGTQAINSSCPIIFAEDKLWIDGVVDQKVTIAAADFVSGTNPSIILNGNITYTSATSSGLLAIAQQDVLVGLAVPTDMTLNGIFVAQNGRFGRNRYCHLNSGSSCNSTRQLPNSAPLNLRQYNLRNSLTINGTIVSMGREGTRWTNAGVYVSGFNTRFNSYDRNLVNDPPPLVPNTSDVFRVTDWRDSR